MMPEHEPHLENREPIFTPLIKELQENSCWEPVNIYQEISNAIAPILRDKMNEKGLWNLPPALLKPPKLTKKKEERSEFYLWKSWNEKGAFEDLLMDCYVYVIYMRLQNLRNRLKVQENIDGYVRMNIGHFLYDARKGGDRVGYHVAMNTRAAVNCATEKEGCITLEGFNRSGNVCNKTLLIFGSPLQEIEPRQLEQNIRKALLQNPNWREGRKVLYKLAGTEEGFEESLCKMICEIVNHLKKLDISHLSFKDLVDVMKDEVRGINPIPVFDSISGDDNDDDNDQDKKKIQIPALPDDDPRLYEEWECWSEWCGNMMEAIKQSGFQKKIKERRLQVFIERKKAVEKQAFEQNPEKNIPSQQRLAEILDVGTGTINTDLGKLRELSAKIKLGDCQSYFLQNLINLTLR